ncbi:MAG: hypothetical protein E3J72_14435 [Planctomycetota bacterium]|nr:MAG: hypothetical protein E3J72_14435 [Planctomycetota bacterium]
MVPTGSKPSINWPEAKPVANPTPKSEPTTTGRGILGKKDDKTDEKSGSKVIVTKKPKITCFDDFDALKGKEENKPVAIFVYWPDRTNSKGQTSKAYQNSQKMIDLLAKSAVQSAFRELNCYKVNYKSLDKSRLKRYGVRGAPTLLFIDATGKVLKRITSSRIKAASLVKLIKTVVKKSDKNLKRLQKKREKAEEKKAKEEEEKK